MSIGDMSHSDLQCAVDNMIHMRVGNLRGEVLVLKDKLDEFERRLVRLEKKG